MIWLVGEILILLLLALLLGLVIGWALQRFILGAGDDGPEHELVAANAKLKEELRAAKKTATSATKEKAEALRSLGAVESELDETRQQLENRTLRVSELESERTSVATAVAAGVAANAAAESESESTAEEDEARSLVGDTDAEVPDEAPATVSDAEGAVDQGDVIDLRSGATATAAGVVGATAAATTRNDGSIGDDSGTTAAEGDDAATTAAAAPEIEIDPSSDPDDLTKISGVGNYLQRVLNEIGIYRFDQIAGLDDEGIDALQAKLENFPNRVRREEWVTQAQALDASKV